MTTFEISAPASAALPAKSRPFADVWLISFGHMLTHWYPATFYLLLPLIGNELGLSYGQIGSILTCQFVCGSLSNIPGGMIADAVPRKGLLMALALCWVGAPYLLMGFTHSYWTLLACAGLVGIGNNFWHPTAIPLLARSFPQRKGFVVSIHGMGGNVGDALAPLAAGFLLASMSWRNVVTVNVVPGILVACIIMFFVGGLNVGGDTGPARKQVPFAAGLRSRLQDLRGLLKNRTVVMISLGSAFRSTTQSALLTFLPLYLARQMGYSPKWVGICMFSLQAAGFAMTPIAGHLSDKMGRQRIIVSSMAMTMVVLLGMAFAGHSDAFVILVAFLGFFLFAVRSVLQAWLLDSTPAHQGGTSIGILFGSQAMGAAIGPLSGGILADHYGLGVVFLFLAGTIVIANLFVFFTPTPERRGV
ncbi:MAG TPA: MFS transporter [Xanthobacteraceae bacterium]|nr:MFS transporter [Xanthobacteraceae bacterium]